MELMGCFEWIAVILLTSVGHFKSSPKISSNRYPAYWLSTRTFLFCFVVLHLYYFSDSFVWAFFSEKFYKIFTVVKNFAN